MFQLSVNSGRSALAGEFGAADGRRIIEEGRIYEELDTGGWDLFPSDGTASERETEMVVEYIERHWSPTAVSGDLLAAMR
jgi:hypothetical protein